MTILAQQPAPSVGLPIASITETTGPFTGIFRLAELTRVPRGTRPPYHLIQLVDTSGTLVGYGWDESFRLNGRPAHLDIVEVSGIARALGGRVVADIHALGVPATVVDHTQAPLLLPVNLCPMPSLIPRLLLAINQINDVHLKRFVNRMLGDKEIAEPFMKLRGSGHHHHAFPAGLLLHSIEVVEIVLSMPNLDTQTRDICVVGGLFHDVGKIRTLSIGGSSLLGCLVSHEHLTLSICKKALDELEAAWPDGAYTLMHVWTAKMTPYAYERKIPAAHIIAAADRISSEGAKHAAAFDKLPPWHRLTKFEDDWYWRPLPPAK